MLLSSPLSWDALTRYLKIRRKEPSEIVFYDAKRDERFVVTDATLEMPNPGEPVRIRLEGRPV